MIEPPEPTEPTDTSPNVCHLCGDTFETFPDAITHLELIHPDMWGDGLERWPDGEGVIYDTTLEPDDFGGTP